MKLRRVQQSTKLDRRRERSRTREQVREAALQALANTPPPLADLAAASSDILRLARAILLPPRQRITALPAAAQTMPAVSQKVGPFTFDGLFSK